MSPQLTPDDIERLGKFVGNQLNGANEADLYDPQCQQAMRDAAKLLIQEILDPFDERVVPDESLDDEPDV